MSTNRPFFSNFFSAFRARSGFQKASSSPTHAGGVSGASLSKATAAAAASTSARAAASNSPSLNNATTTTTTPSQIIPSSAPLATSPRKATTTTTSPISVPGVTYQRHHHTTPYSRSPGTSPGPARGFRSGSITPSSNTSNALARGRRGSDSSTEGFREILGAEKWYIGGRTATGEERFYRLGMVRKPPSIDRLSADRLSL